ncbi:GIY-YIG nuclease family protein [Mesorhizobium sp. M0915]|uniref:GIY-YIG nuclease family protein n=1 Tax=Mesorhizobium sp. M0915 TaxID=2957027 RepID=UPI0033375C61
MEKLGFVYKITNLLNGKVYVGQTTQRPAKRWTSHKALSANPKWPIHRAIARHGIANFEFAVIEECADREALDLAECRWIAELRCKKPRGYNITDGGGGTQGYRFSPEARAKLGDRMRGRVVSPETGRKISASKKGWKPSSETIARSAESRRGKHHSDERKAKIGKAHCGRKLSAEHIARRTASRSGYKLSASAREAISRPVIAAGIEYRSVSQAAAALSISTAAVQRRIEKGVAGYSSLIEKKKRRRRTPEQIERHRTKLGKSVLAGGVEYGSAAAASQALGVTRQAIRYRILAGHAGYEFKVAL